MIYAAVQNGMVVLSVPGQEDSSYAVNPVGGAAFRARIEDLGGEYTKSSTMDFPWEGGVPRHLELAFRGWFEGEKFEAPEATVNGKKLSRAVALLEEARSAFEDLVDDAEDEGEEAAGEIVETMDELFAFIGSTVRGV